MSYASSTSITPVQSQAELIAMLARYGATNVKASNEEVGWTLGDCRTTLEFRVPKGARDQAAFWRVMLLVVQAELEAVTWGIRRHMAVTAGPGMRLTSLPGLPPPPSQREPARLPAPPRALPPPPSSTRVGVSVPLGKHIRGYMGF